MQSCFHMSASRLSSSGLIADEQTSHLLVQLNSCLLRAFTTRLIWIVKFHHVSSERQSQLTSKLTWFQTNNFRTLLVWNQT